MATNIRLSLIVILCKLCWSLQRDTVIQFQRSGVVGKVETVEQVLVNGDSLSSFGKDVSRILKAVLLSNYSNKTLKMIEENIYNTMKKEHKNQYMRVWECKMSGFQVLVLSDRLLVDGKDFLSLDQTTDTWTAEVPQALTLKQLWDRDSKLTRRERMQLHDSCTELIKEITCEPNKRPTEAGMDMMSVLAPLLAGLAFISLAIASFLISNKQDPTIPVYPGGVIGSIVHYPQNH
ncbi:hypothetical protein UPYG_G00288740 [Umbra pygmaea]|uniref:MHC class I-like antigen recognition-like domain-containing protein n=1 Tax=Umbra pygmaea TaxID=75934 RepID=A0ABD0W8M7_UMBPY